MIRLIRVTNPLQVDRDREIVDVPFDGSTLRTILAEQAMAEGAADSEEWAAGVTVSVNGTVWAKSVWNEVTPRDGSSIVIAPLVQNGSLLRTLASVALLAGSIALAASGAGAAFAGFLASAGISTTTAVASSILVGAANIGGNLLISAFLGNTPNKPNESASYDPDGPKSLAQSGTVIPKGYGTFRWGGNIISSFTDIEGANQYINCLVCFGFGPARSITGLQINGKDISEYNDVQYYVRLGTNDQTEIVNFNRVVNGYPQDTQCLAGVPVVVPGTGDLTSQLQVDVAFPDGVFVNTNDGNIIPAQVSYLVEWRASGSSGPWTSVLQPQTTTNVIAFDSQGNPILPYAWAAVATDLPPNSGVVYALDNGPHNPGDPFSTTQTVDVINPDLTFSTASKVCKGEWQLLNPDINQVLVETWTSGYVNFTGSSTSPLYNRTNIYGLTPGKYDVRVTKWGSGRWASGPIPYGDNFSPNVGQDLWVHSVNEISLLDLRYPNMILVGVRALATSQISGASVNITALIEHGLRTVDEDLQPAALAGFEEDNPACVAADMMLDDLYGGGESPGITGPNIERFIDEWVAWAELNDTLVPDGNGNNIRLHVFNGIFDNEDNLWNQLNVVGKMSRAAIIPMGLDYGVFVDKVIDAPVQMFSMGNILQDSFTETWLNIDDRANQVEVQFADSTRYYREDNPLVYMDPAQQDAGVIIKNVRVRLKGCTIPAQAWHYARYKQRCNQFQLRTGSFRTDTDGIACRPGSAILLQHDVPKWGWGGRILPGSTTTKLLIDRTDIEFKTGVSYSVVILHAAIPRYVGTVTGVTPTTEPPGFAVTLSSFDNDNRVTRALFTPSPGAMVKDCAIISAAAGTVTVLVPPGFTPANGMAYGLYDTDVMETVGVSAIDPVTKALVLATPLSQAPDDFAQYIYGPAGAAKTMLAVTIKKASEQRSTVEYIDYDSRCYDIGTPVIGETSAQTTTNAAVTSLVGGENFQKIAGSYASFAQLAWRNGPDTVGVGIYSYFLNPAGVGATASFTGTTTNGSPTVTAVSSLMGLVIGQPVSGAGIPANTTIANLAAGTITLSANATATATAVALTSPQLGTPSGTPQLIARLTGEATSWQTQITPGVVQVFIVVGFDINNTYASMAQAPEVTIAAVGIAQNLLLGSSFASGFTYWNLTARAGDTLVAEFDDDGQAVYTTAGSALATAQTLLYQVVPPSKWAIGNLLMLSAYFEDSCVSPGAPNVGNCIATIVFLDASGSIISSVAANVALNGVTPTLKRCNTAATAVPAGTVQVLVAIGVGGSGLNIPVGSTLTFSHLLLEIASSGQTEPSAWADIDVNGQVLDIFQTGSSTGLRVQGSVLPTFTGSISYTSTATSLTIAWANLVIFWPDGAFTDIQDGSMTITGLTTGDTYYGYLYFDIIQGGVKAAKPATPVGTPSILSASADSGADALCRQDGRLALTPGGISMICTGGGSGGVGGPPPPPHLPITLP